MKNGEEMYHMLVGWRYPLAGRQAVGVWQKNLGYQTVAGWQDLLRVASENRFFGDTAIQAAETEQESLAAWEALGEKRVGVSVAVLLFDFEIETVKAAHALACEAADILLSETDRISDLTGEERNAFVKAYQIILTALDHGGDPFNLIHHLGTPEMLIYRKIKNREPSLPKIEKAMNNLSEARNMLSDERYNTGKISAGSYMTR